MAKKDAPKEAEKKPEPVETKAVAVKPAAGFMQSLDGASADLIERISEVRDNLSSVENFKLPRVKMTGDGAEIMEGEEPLMELEGVILHTKRTNVYYEKPFNPNNPEPPRCYSTDGDYPATDIKDKEGNALAPIHATCKGCPMAEFGTNQMKSGKACRNLKPIYMLLGDGAIMPRQLTVTPTSLKAANQFLIGLTERGISYRKIKTKITFSKDNPRDTYVKAAFTMGAKLSPEEQKDIEVLRRNWLPVIDSQIIDQNEFESGSSPQAQNQEPVQTGGEF